jgi:hypothetical protein
MGALTNQRFLLTQQLMAAIRVVSKDGLPGLLMDRVTDPVGPFSAAYKESCSFLRLGINGITRAFLSGVDSAWSRA